MEKAFPNMKLMHCYRNAFGVSKSWYEVIAESTTDSGLDEAFTRASAHPHSTEFIHEYAVQTTTYSWLNALDLIPPDRPQDQFEWCIITWAASKRVTKLAQSKGIDIKCICYESLVSEKDNYILKIFEYLGIDQNLVQNVLGALERDSQQDNQYSHEAQKKKPRQVGSKESINRCDRILSRLGNPILKTDFIMPNTR